MSETLHNHCLQTLGIVRYIPRDQPVVARISAHSQLPEPQQAEEPLQFESGQQDSVAANPKLIIDLNSLGLDGQTEGKTQAVTAQETVETAIQLKFALWQPTDQLLVCSSVTDTLPDPQQLKLLSNILIAMGQGSGNLPQMEIVGWPPHPNISGDELEVREFLLTLIRARVDSRAAKIVLLLGDLAADWLLSSQQKRALSNGQVDIFDQVTGLLIPSLAAMIEQPQLKRQAWQRVRFLSPMAQKTQSPSD